MSSAPPRRLRKVRDGVGKAIFGQDAVIEQTLVTLLAGGHGLLIGVPGLAKTKLVETLGIVLGLDWKRIQFTPDLMPTDIIGSEVLEERRRQARLPLPQRPGVHPAADGGRDQPRQPAHAIRAAAGDAGAACHGRRAALRPAASRSMCWRRRIRWSRKAPIRCPKRSSTASCCRSTSAIPTRRPSGACCSPPPSATRRRPSAVCTPDDLMEAQQIVRHIPVGEKVVDAILQLVRAARPGEDGAEGHPRLHRLGPGPARQPGLHAGGARARADRRTARAVDRRCRGAGAAGPAPPHGAHLLRRAPKA